MRRELGYICGAGSRPRDKGGGGGGLPKKFFGGLWASVKGGGDGLPGPSPGSATANVLPSYWYNV